MIRPRTPVANIIHREPVSISVLSADAGKGLAQIIKRALEKNAGERFQTADELWDELKKLQKELELAETKSSEARTVVYDSAAHAVAGPPETNVTRAGSLANEQTAAGQDVSTAPVPSALRRKIILVALLALILIGGAFGAFRYLANRGTQQINSIAVMPFVNASGNSDVEYLSDGLTDSLIFRFSQLPNVKVSPTRTNYVRPYYFAHLYAALGDKEKAFAALEESLVEKDSFLSRLGIDPAFDPLREDPRFKSILKRMNLPA